MSWTKRIIVLAVLISLNGCQTIHGVGSLCKGVGEDLQSVSSGYSEKNAEQAYRDGLNGVSYND